MAVDKIHKKQRFFYWAERTAGILQMTFLKMILPPSDLLRQEQQ